MVSTEILAHRIRNEDRSIWFLKNWFLENGLVFALHYHERLKKKTERYRMLYFCLDSNATNIRWTVADRLQCYLIIYHMKCTEFISHLFSGQCSPVNRAKCWRFSRTKWKWIIKDAGLTFIKGRCLFYIFSCAYLKIGSRHDSQNRWPQSLVWTGSRKASWHIGHK